MDQEFEEIESQLELLDERIEGCRRAILLSRVAIWLGAVTLVAVVFLAPSYRTPPVVLGAIAIMMAGTVWLGASGSSRDDARREREGVEARKNALLDEIVARNGWREASTSLH